MVCTQHAVPHSSVTLTNSLALVGYLQSYLLRRMITLYKLPQASMGEVKDLICPLQAQPGISRCDRNVTLM